MGWLYPIIFVSSSISFFYSVFVGGCIMFGAVLPLETVQTGLLFFVSFIPTILYIFVYWFKPPYSLFMLHQDVAGYLETPAWRLGRFWIDVVARVASIAYCIYYSIYFDQNPQLPDRGWILALVILLFLENTASTIILVTFFVKTAQNSVQEFIRTKNQVCRWNTDKEKVEMSVSSLKDNFHTEKVGPVSIQTAGTTQDAPPTYVNLSPPQYNSLFHNVTQQSTQHFVASHV